jgi:hypothetical protein
MLKRKEGWFIKVTVKNNSVVPSFPICELKVGTTGILVSCPEEFLCKIGEPVTRAFTELVFHQSKTYISLDHLHGSEMTFRHLTPEEQIIITAGDD